MKKVIPYLGPAFIAAIAYVDPGNIASNVSAGLQYKYLLTWVIVLASAIAAIIQYQSAKLGLVTGYSLPALIGSRVHNNSYRYLFWLQAELIAIITDLGEAVGGALALNLLFGIPLGISAAIVGAISFVLLFIQKSETQHYFEWIIIAFLAVISLGFVLGVVIDPPPIRELFGGLVPRFGDINSLLLAASIVGATIMPHSIYLHSGIVLDRFGVQRGKFRTIRHLLRVTKYDIFIALGIATLVNVCLLLLAAHSLYGIIEDPSITATFQAIKKLFGSVVGIIFALGLLASGIASTSVGAYAGSMITGGLLNISQQATSRIVYIRRFITIIPAIILLSLPIDTTQILIFSQVILCVGVPLVLIPLLRYTGDHKIMGIFVDSWQMKTGTYISSVLIIILNTIIVAVEINNWVT